MIGLELSAAVKKENYLRTLPFLNEVVCGDCQELLKSLPSNSIDLVITSPPYFKQRDYSNGLGNEMRVEDYLANLLNVFGECVRIIKPTGSIVFNLGDKYEDSSLLLVPFRFAIAATENYPVRLVNNITWVKSNPTPRQFKRRLVSSTEPFFHFVKSDKYKYFADEFRRREKVEKANGNTSEKLGRRYFELIENSNLNPAQKEMARVKLTEIIEEVRSGKIQGFRMKIRGIHSEPFGGQEGGRKIQLDRNGFTIIRIHGNPLKRDVITSAVESLKECPHRAIYPTEIVEEFLNLLTESGDVVCDPFLGSGSTAVAALRKRRNFIGFEINAEYCEYAKARLRETAKQLELYG